jgi:Ca2+-binding RTX toxin-like protein
MTFLAMILPDAIAYAIWGGDSDTSDANADPHPNEDGLNSINGEGDDLVEGGGGNDVIITGNGEDTVSKGRGSDLIIGVDGADQLGQPDQLSGGYGSDSLWGDDGDTLTGGEGTDFFDVTVGTESAETVTIADLDFSGMVTAPCRIGSIL